MILYLTLPKRTRLRSCPISPWHSVNSLREILWCIALVRLDCNPVDRLRVLVGRVDDLAVLDNRQSRETLAYHRISKEAITMTVLASDLPGPN